MPVPMRETGDNGGQSFLGEAFSLEQVAFETEVRHPNGDAK